MDDTSTASTRPAARTGARRGAPSRLQRVESFVGVLANEAAQAVRRAGLKPGLERSFGCEPELTGRVVAQEPEPGAELARNGLVTLYVAAPAAAAEPAAERAALERPEQEQLTRALAHAELASDPATAPRRRKSGRLDSRPVFDVSPAPRMPGEIAGDPELASADGDAYPERAHLQEPADVSEQDVIAADMIFARGRRRVSWQTASVPIAWLGGRLRRSPRLLRAAVLLVGLWLLVAGAAALFAHGSRRVAPPRSPAARTSTERVVARPPRAAALQQAAPYQHTPRAQRRRARASRTRRREARTPVRRMPRARPPSEPSPAARPPAPSPSIPAPHHEGGLFSP
jgi:hypothetical protein